MTTAADTYARIVDDLTVEPDVDVGRMFRSEGLHVRTRYFALMTRGELVVKLPAERAAQLAAAGTGEPFEPSPGRAMREWLTLADTHLERWPALVDEALAYARALGPKPPKREALSATPRRPGPARPATPGRGAGARSAP